MSQPREWDAGTYHRVSAPQYTWGLRVLERLALRSGDHVLDAGCGTGRVTAALVERALAHSGRVTALDHSIEMTRAARRTLPAHVPVVVGDLVALPFRHAFDVVFSTATFHWVMDHEQLYRQLAAVLRSGGRVHAQCGGAGNLRAFHDRVHLLTGLPRFAPWFSGWRDPWVFLAPAAAAVYIRAAGFTEARTWLEPAPATFASRADYRMFIERVVLGAWMARLAGAASEREAFLDVLCDAAEEDAIPFTLDYVRLNIEAALPEETA